MKQIPLTTEPGSLLMLCRMLWRMLWSGGEGMTLTVQGEEDAH